jgi:peptide/nickel transport system permease protein
MREFGLRFVRNRSALLGLLILWAIVAIALAGPLIYPGDPFGLVAKPFLRPFGEFFFGTDMLGRSVAAGIVHGARTSLLIGLVATVVAVSIGLLFGGVAGYFGGRLDALLMRFTELFQTIPSFIFAIVLVAVLGPTIMNVIVAISAVTWPPVARLVRGEFLSMRNRDFVHACTCAGLSDARIIGLHILPNCASAIVVTASLMIANAVLIESSLSFLGLSDPNVMSWGLMIGAGRVVLRTAWWVCAIPGVAILLTVLAINLAGDGLNDALNPRLRRL